MPTWFFVSDLHGRPSRYRALFSAIDRERPRAVFLGGDLLPSFGFALPADEEPIDDFIRDFLVPGFRDRPSKPRVFLILGNDDPRAQEPGILDAQADGVWEYVHGRAVDLDGHRVFGYAYVNPTPFGLKDWER